MSSNARKAMKAMLKFNPEDRMKAEELMNLPFFSKHGIDINR
jgi:hypothetical protein